MTRAACTLLVFLLVRGDGRSETCFDAKSNQGLPFEVHWQAPPPRDAQQANYPYYPMSATATQDIAKLNGTRLTPLDRYYFLWANRCHDLEGKGACGWNKKGNVVFPKLTAPDGADVRTYFTTFERANDCTLAQTARLLDFPADVVNGYALRSGLKIVPKGDDLLALRKGARLVDLCLIENEPLAPEAQGVLIDYEVQDGRTPEQTLAFLKEFTDLVHRKSKKAILLTNPFDAPTQRYTGMAESNAHAIYEAFDRTLVMLWHNNRQKDMAASYRSQMAMLKAGGPVDPKRLLLLFELNQTTDEETRFARALLETEKPAGVMFWRNYAVVGGPCSSPTNRKIACLVFGDCD